MNKYILLFIVFLYPFSVSANVDESKIDIYFANGIMTKEETARYNALSLLKPAIENEIFGTEQELQKHIGKVDYAYNSTHGWGVATFRS